MEEESSEPRAGGRRRWGAGEQRSVGVKKWHSEKLRQTITQKSFLPGQVSINFYTIPHMFRLTPEKESWVKRLKINVPSTSTSWKYIYSVRQTSSYTEMCLFPVKIPFPGILVTSTIQIKKIRLVFGFYASIFLERLLQTIILVSRQPIDYSDN